MRIEKMMDDEFPIGMRVLAVGDNAVYLKTLETLLLECKFQVTTANEGTTALKLLRENKNEFDLVITDVKMPGMDGFDLLKIVRLEMDLPVIMLSKHGDKELIMKGITHGACDYLVKPVQLHVLKNIWQHVFRKKLRYTERINSDKARGESGEVQEELKGTGNVDHDSKSDNKRKYQNCEENEDSDKKGQDFDDPSSQKRSRIVWAGELHEKFVSAVNALGVDEAVPKRILELMNDEKITRENVASHLQKYRQRLKRSTSVGSNELKSWRVDTTRNMNCARNTPHPAVRNSNPLPGLGSCSRLSQSPGVAQWGQRDNLVNRIQHEPNFRNSSIPNMPYGTPMPPKLDSREHYKDLALVAEKSAVHFGSSHHTVSNDTSDRIFNANRARNSGFARNTTVFGNSSSNAGPSLHSDSLSMLPNFGGLGNWPTATQRTRLCYEQSLSIGSRDHIPMLPANMGMSSHEVSSFNSVSNVIPDIRTHSQRNMNQNLIQVKRTPKEECFNQSSDIIGPENALAGPLENNNQFPGFQMNNEDLDFLRTDLDDITMEQLDNATETDINLRLEKPTL